MLIMLGPFHFYRTRPCFRHIMRWWATVGAWSNSLQTDKHSRAMRRSECHTRRICHVSITERATVIARVSWRLRLYNASGRRRCWWCMHGRWCKLHEGVATANLPICSSVYGSGAGRDTPTTVWRSRCRAAHDKAGFNDIDTPARIRRIIAELKVMRRTG